MSLALVLVLLSSSGRGRLQQCRRPRCHDPYVMVFSARLAAVGPVQLEHFADAKTSSGHCPEPNTYTALSLQAQRRAHDQSSGMVLF